MSPKNKGKFGKGKSQVVAESDEFLDGMERLIRWLKPHALKLGILFGVVAVVVVSWTVWGWWHHRKDSRATALYERASVISQVPVRADDQPIPDKDEEALPPDPRNVPRHYASDKDRAQAELNVLDQLESDYGSTGPARQGLLLRANAYYSLGRYDEAARDFRAYAGSAQSTPLVVAAREGLGYALEAKATAEKDPKAHQAGLEQALKAFEAMQPDPAQTDSHNQAVFHQARVLAEMGRTDEAVKRFQSVLTNRPDPMLKQDVELRLLALKARPKKK